MFLLLCRFLTYELIAFIESSISEVISFIEIVTNSHSTLLISNSYIISLNIAKNILFPSIYQTMCLEIYIKFFFSFIKINVALCVRLLRRSKNKYDLNRLLIKATSNSISYNFLVRFIIKKAFLCFSIILYLYNNETIIGMLLQSMSHCIHSLSFLIILGKYSLIRILTRFVELLLSSHDKFELVALDKIVRAALKSNTSYQRIWTVIECLTRARHGRWSIEHHVTCY